MVTPESNQNCKLDHEGLLFYFNFADIHTDIVTNSKRLSFLKKASCLRVISINVPIDRSIDWEFKAFVYPTWHHKYFRAVVKKSVGLKLLIEKHLGSA